MSKIPVDPLTEAEYAACFQTFAARTTEYSSMLKWSASFLSEKQYKNTATGDDRRQAQGLSTRLAILSIGAGTGYFDELFINKLSSPPRLYTAIEPNEQHFQQLKHRFANSDFETQFVQEYFSPRLQIDQKYDIILMSHCLYPIPDPNESMIHASTFLSPIGSLIVFIQTEKSMCKFFTKYASLFEWSAPPLADHSVSTHSLCHALDIDGIKYDLYICPSYVDVAAFFASDLDIVHDLLTFYVQTNTRKLPAEIVADMIDDIKMGVDIGTNYSHPGGVIVISKEETRDHTVDQCDQYL